MEGDPIVLDAAYNVSSFSFFKRGTVKDVCRFLARTLVKRAGKSNWMSVTENEFVIHTITKANGLGGVWITDEEYPQRVAFGVLNNILDEFNESYGGRIEGDRDGSMPMDSLKDYITKFQDPMEADAILRVQKELDETKIIVHKAIDSVLERGERLDNLVQVSGDLSSQAKGFYRTSRDANKCCVVL